MMYAVKVTDDVLKVADVEVNYIDQTGAKKKEKLGTTEWKKTFSTNTLPVTEGVWAKMTPKTNIGTGSYSLQVTTAAGYQAKLANGKTIADGYGGKAHYRADCRRDCRLVQPESYDKLCYRPDRL